MLYLYNCYVLYVILSVHFGRLSKHTEITHAFFVPHLFIFHLRILKWSCPGDQNYSYTLHLLSLLSLLVCIIAIYFFTHNNYCHIISSLIMHVYTMSWGTLILSQLPLLWKPRGAIRYHHRHCCRRHRRHHRRADTFADAFADTIADAITDTFADIVADALPRPWQTV